MKKILFLVESLGGGGAERVLTTIVKNIDKSKFDVTVMSIVNVGVYVEEIKQFCRYEYMLENDDNLNILQKIKYRLDYKFIYSQSPEKVYKKYIKEKYDIEVAFVEGFTTKLIAASNNPTSKKICWVHIDMQENPYADKYYRSVEEEKATYKKYDSIIGVSQTVKQTFEMKFGLNEKVQVIYNPIDSMEIIERANEFEVTKTSELTLVTTGRLVRQKGYDRLIKVLNDLENNNLSFVLWILGEGAERKNLEMLIEQYALQTKIKLLGFQSNPYPWVKAADLFVCSSRAEGYSLAIAEAMILGKPIISVDCAGPNELLGDGNYGILVENSDSSLREALAAVVNGEVDLHYYGGLSKSRNSFFKLENVIQQIEKVFIDE